jgi:hypothetical protein
MSMREPADADLIRRFMRAFGDAAREEGRCYLAGGATAVLLGWRRMTLDIDISLEPEQHEAMREIPRIKQELGVNVELASPADFIPLPEGWEERSISIGREGRLTFLHLDPYAQALAKLERAHELDLEDVRTLLDRGLVDPDRLRRAFEEIEPRLYRFPAVDPASFRARVDEAARLAS